MAYMIMLAEWETEPQYAGLCWLISQLLDSGPHYYSKLNLIRDFPELGYRLPSNLSYGYDGYEFRRLILIQCINETV